MCGTRFHYSMSSEVMDGLELARSSNETLDPMLVQHIKDKHSAFSSLFEQGRNEGYLVTDWQGDDMNKFRGMFNVTHRERKSV